MIWAPCRSCHPEFQIRCHSVRWTQSWPWWGASQMRCECTVDTGWSPAARPAFRRPLDGASGRPGPVACFHRAAARPAQVEVSEITSFYRRPHLIYILVCGSYPFCYYFITYDSVMLARIQKKPETWCLNLLCFKASGSLKQDIITNMIIFIRP